MSLPPDPAMANPPADSAGPAPVPAPAAARPSRLGRVALIALLVLGITAGWLWDAPAALRRAMASVTGEEALWEQVKGTGAWLLLSLSGEPDTAPLTPMRHSGLSPYGINTFLEQEAEDVKVERSLALIADAGFDWIRQEFPWEDIEISGKGDHWDHRWNRSAWAKYDRIVELAGQHGIAIVARLDNPPAWSRAVGEAEGWTMGPPDDLNDYGDFVYAVVSRYRGRIRYYQIWNEPNIYPEWGDQPVDPEAYVDLLKVAYTRAKEADPDCVILAAGLAQTLETGPRNLNDIEFLQRMYAAGAADYFDIMGAMVYGLWTGPLDRRASTDRTNFARAQLIREIMVRHGDADKPIWATEVGWNAVPESFLGPAIYGRVTEEQQALYAVQAYERAAREWPWMGVMNYWFFRRPSDAERNQSWFYFRMLEPDFARLPVYGAMQELTARRPAVSLGYHQEDHWALRYDGPWSDERSDEAVLGGYRAGGPGTGFAFEFQGTALDLVVLDPTAAAGIEVYLDGNRVRRLTPGQAPVNRAPTVRVASNLRDITHSVRVVVRSGSLALDGVVVQRRSGWAIRLVPLAMALLAGALVSLWLRRRSRP